MTTSPTSHPSSTSERVPLRVRLRGSTSVEHVDGAWWPQSRNLQIEAADLIDHLPDIGYVNRLLFSRPDWDDSAVGDRGVRRIAAARGPVKVGSFPSDDTRLMILVLATGRRVRLRVIASDTAPDEANRLLREITSADPSDGTDLDRARWDHEEPAF
jgi:Family of unknown function (DUF5994)